jgi:tRNA dimethylallyltransferase
VGATATGKTAAAVMLAQRFAAEIISADSRQVYRGMSIGTAKPTAAERTAAPHHLLDIRDPDEPFSLAEYLALARAAVVEIGARGRLPLLVGGTAQYIYGVIEGWQVPPTPPQPALRARLEAEGAERLHARLLAVDPVAAAQIDPRNLRRLVRALEVWEVTGRPISAWQQKQSPPYPVLRLGLRLSRPALHARAAARVDAMLAAGLVEEVRALLAAGYDPALPALQSMGYSEIIAHLRGELSLAQAREAIVTNTNRFIRRQETWFRRDPAIVWVDADDPTAPARLIELVAAALAGRWPPLAQ